MSLVIREARGEEFPRLEAFSRAAADFARRMGGFCLCAEEEGRIAGAVWARRAAGAEGETPALEMAVAPDARGRDVGERLLRAALGALRDRGYRQASVFAPEDASARAALERAGFRPASEGTMVAALRGGESAAGETHAARAARLFREGCNCAQAVFVAYRDWTGLDEAASIRLSASFGGGMGRLREVCGALSGALMALGMLRAPLDPADRAAKAAHYARVQALGNAFRAHNGSLLCRDLLGEQAGSGHVPDERTEAYYQSRPCERLIYDAANLLERMLLEEAP